MSNISWLYRRKSIYESFIVAYFGHVLLEKGIWRELEQWLDTYFASIENARHRKHVINNETYHEAFMKLVEELVYIMTNHPVNQFPVSLPHKRGVARWLLEYLRRQISLIDESEFQQTLLNKLYILDEKDDDVNDIEVEDPEYIFKTFVRRIQEPSSIEFYYVTLLEENRNIIGHGTTGLTSWQGALFLADWFQAQPEKLKVVISSLLDRLFLSLYQMINHIFRDRKFWN